MPPQPYPSRKVILPTTLHPSSHMICGNISKREYLKIDFANTTGFKTMAVIMMNPAYANQTISDNTVNGLINLTHNKPLNVSNTGATITDIGSLLIFNLIPIYKPNSIDIYEDIKTVANNGVALDILFNDNNETIKNNITNADYIVLAWGEPDKLNISLPLYYRQIFEIQKIVSETQIPLFVVSDRNGKYLSKRCNPLHPSRKGSRVTLKQVMIDSLNCIKLI